jgi:hypothetical protein
MSISWEGQHENEGHHKGIEARGAARK